MRVGFVCLAVVMGCGSGRGDDGSSARADAAADPDASAGQPDGAPVDGGFRPAACDQDADQAPTCAAAAPEERVAIETYPGIPVVFHDPSGCVRCRTVADGDGLAEAALPDGGMATIVGDQVAFTVGGLSPGDSIHIGYPSPPASTNARTFRVNTPDQAGAAEYRAVVGVCSGTAAAPPIDLVVDDSCLDGDGSASILVLATDVGGSLLARGWIGDAAAPPVGETGQVSLPAWATASSPATFAVSSIPPDIGDLSVSFGWVADRFLYSSSSVSASAQGAAAVDLDVAVPSLPGAPDFFAITLDRAMGHDTDIDLLVRVVDDVAPPVAIDVPTDFLPHIETTSHDGQVDRPVFTWVTAAEPADADILVVRADWEQFEWWVALPPDTAQPVAFPDLPDDLGPRGRLGRYAFVMYADVTTVTTWSEARADAYAFFALLFLPRSPWPMEPGFSYRLAVYDDLDPPGP